MSKTSEMVAKLKKEGYDNGQIADFLCDGEALAACGFTDDDQSDIEDEYEALGE